MENSSVSKQEFVLRAEEHLARIVRLGVKGKEERRTSREDGHVGKILRDSLRACNVAQLQEVKKLCDRFIEDHRRPPDEFECSAAYIMKVLASVCVRNKRYQLEIRRGSFRRKVVYLNGPYLYSYWRDGRLVRKQYLKKGKGMGIPRKVKEALKRFASQAVVDAEMESILKAHEGADRERVVQLDSPRALDC